MRIRPTVRRDDVLLGGCRGGMHVDAASQTTDVPASSALDGHAMSSELLGTEGARPEGRRQLGGGTRHAMRVAGRGPSTMRAPQSAGQCRHRRLLHNSCRGSLRPSAPRRVPRTAEPPSREGRLRRCRRACARDMPERAVEGPVRQGLPGTPEAGRGCTREVPVAGSGRGGDPDARTRRKQRSTCTFSVVWPLRATRTRVSMPHAGGCAPCARDAHESVAMRARAPRSRRYGERTRQQRACR